jgi:hypothetical protein
VAIFLRLLREVLLVEVLSCCFGRENDSISLGRCSLHSDEGSVVEKNDKSNSTEERSIVRAVKFLPTVSSVNLTAGVMRDFNPN